jgi:DHA1 family multidrug resistance protein-like MFS transporter
VTSVSGSGGVGQSSPAGRLGVTGLYLASSLYTLGEGSVHVLLSPHLAEQGLSGSAIGPVIAAYGVAALVSRFLMGAVYRVGRVRYLVAGGCVLSAASLLVIARSSSPGLLALLVGMQGIGFALVSTGSLAALIEYRQGGNAGAIMGWYTGCIAVGYACAGFLGGFTGNALGPARALTVLAVIPLAAAVAFAFVLRRVRGGPPAATEQHGGIRGALAGFTNANALIWLAFAVVFHANFLHGMLQAYFPLYALGIGLSLAQIGALVGMHSGLSAAIRFAAPPLFRVVPYRRLLPWMVALGGLSVAAMAGATAYVLLAIAWCVLGLTRGLLRVSSSALVMDAAGPSSKDRGAVSGLYLAGLDLGRILGPITGGFATQAVGFTTTFLVVGLSFPLVFFVFAAWLARRRTP